MTGLLHKTEDPLDKSKNARKTYNTVHLSDEALANQPQPVTIFVAIVLSCQ